MTWELRMRNVAGIEAGEAVLSPGVNAIRADNWQGKSSFLAAIETVMGTATPLTEGRERGGVELDADDSEFSVAIVRERETVVRSGDPYLSEDYDAVRADLYAFLDESNAVRRAVRRGENLQEVLTRPLDFENIESRIAELETEREEIDAELARADDAAERLPEVTETVERLTEERADLRSRRDTLVDGEDDGSSAAREELSDARAERNRVEGRIERLERAVERTRETLADRRSELAALPEPSDAGVEQELTAARDALRDAERDADLLRSVYSVSERLLEEDRLELVTDVEHGLVHDDFACWICGGETHREAVVDRLDTIRERLADRQSAAADRRDRVSELERIRERRERAERERETVAERIADLEATLADRRRSLAGARGRLAELNETAASLCDAVETVDDDLVEIESEIKYVDSRLADVREERDVLSAQVDKRSALEAEREDLTADLVRLRDRTDELRRRTREAFDEAIDRILDRFDTGFETARLTSSFDLVVAREGREASLDALSEGELELLGIVTALAGHEAFDVGDRVPVLLLDGLGGLADENLHALIDCLRERARFLVFTAYPEHGAFDGHEIDPTDWDVVSQSTPS